ncbi:hypothetical protein B9H02_03015 [Prosthecochloris sp. HL-130-GSB]|nr:hypothetical protein B9H02_03015 [Prosthecochloris sp. HL-130-GSB]
MTCNQKKIKNQPSKIENQKNHPCKSVQSVGSKKKSKVKRQKSKKNNQCKSAYSADKKSQSVKISGICGQQ